jgi:hypothetical protein
MHRRVKEERGEGRINCIFSGITIFWRVINNNYVLRYAFGIK